MGNQIIRDKFGCYDVQNHEYQQLRAKNWAFHQSYLYQTQLQNIAEGKLRVISYQLDPQEKQFKTYFQKLKMMGRYLLKGNIQLPILCITENVQQCACRISQNKNVKFYYEYYQIPLNDQIKARQKLKQKFSEGQVWYIFYNILNGLRQFQPFGQPSGNITVKEIMMNSKGQIKIRNLLTSPFQTPRSSIFTNYFAPQQLYLMNNLFNNEGVITREVYRQKKINPNLCQVYSLAILILVLCTFQHHLIFYNPPFGINQANINLAIQKINTMGYSKLLINIIRVMLADHKSRPFPEQIFQTFKQFQFQILHFKSFSFSLNSSEVRSIY